MENKGIIDIQSTVEGSNHNVGDNANQITNYNSQSELADITRQLLNSLNGIEGLNIETKQEMEEVINAAAEEAGKDKPRNGIIKSFLDQTKNVITTISATPSLITAYDKWKTFLESIIQSGN